DRGRTGLRAAAGTSAVGQVRPAALMAAGLHALAWKVGGHVTGITEKKTLVYREELTPVSFLERAGTVHADRIAPVDGNRRYSYREWRARSRRLAHALRGAGLQKDDRVAFLAFNSEPLLLGHFGVLQAGGIIVAINTRLSADEIAYIVDHSGS